jgi:hypothetical protein
MAARLGHLAKDAHFLNPFLHFSGTCDSLRFSAVSVVSMPKRRTEINMA